MPTQADRLLVELAVKNHLISQAEGDASLAELPAGVDVGTHLVSKNLLKDRHLASLKKKLEKVLEERGGAGGLTTGSEATVVPSGVGGPPAQAPNQTDATFVAPPAAASPLLSGDGAVVLFGQLAVKQKLVNEADLERALRLQEQLAAQGTPMRLGAILVRAKRLSNEQVHELLRFQEKWIATCGTCGKRYNVSGSQTPSALRCPACGGALGSSTSGSGISVAQSHPGALEPTPPGGAPRPQPSNAHPSGPQPHAGGSSAAADLSGRGQPSPDDPAGLLGRTWKGHKVEKVLGKGGMGAVYKAVQTTLRRPVALKVMLRGAGQAAAGERERFEREAKLVGGLGHPNIVPVYTAEWSDDLCWFTMEMVQGKDFKVVLRSGESPIRKGAEVVAKVARAMDFAHKKGVIHRDLKPQNIMIVDETGEPKVLDFGLAKNISAEGKSVEQLTQMGAFLGTPAYMAPEQAGGDPNNIDARADVYALGAILYEVLTGRPPFTGKKPIQVIRAVLKEDPIPCRQVFPQAPAELEAVAMKALKKVPGDRFQTAGELADAIEAVIGKVSRVLGAAPVQSEGGDSSKPGTTSGAERTKKTGFLGRFFGSNG